MEDIAPKGEVAVAEWAKFKDGMGKVDAWYAKNGRKGLFLLEETPSWGDIVYCHRQLPRLDEDSGGSFLRGIMAVGRTRRGVKGV